MECRLPLGKLTTLTTYLYISYISIAIELQKVFKKVVN